MNQTLVSNQTCWKWWSQHRLRYNIGLVIAGVVAFIAYAILSEILIMPYDHDFEISLFTILVQGIGYWLMIGIANIFYFLGPLVDLSFNKKGSEVFRIRLFAIGFWFSVALPFLIPTLIVFQYFTNYAK